MHDRDETSQSVESPAAAPARSAASAVLATRSPARRAPLMLQAKLVVGSVDDPLEHEADQLADRVVADLRRSTDATPEFLGAADVGRVRPAVRPRQTDSGQTSAEHTGAEPTVGRVRRAATSTLSDPLGGGELDAATTGRIQAARGGGQALPDTLRSPMEQSFGRSLESVRVHTDTQADDLSRSISAKAFTTGNDIFFAAGQFQPASTGGQHLIAHEVAHTVQQAGGAGDVGRAVQRDVVQHDVIQREPDDPAAAAKLQADLSMLSVHCEVISTHLNLLTTVLPVMITTSTAAMADPAMIGPLEAAKAGALGMLQMIEHGTGLLQTAWARVEPIASASNMGAVVPTFSKVIADLTDRVREWKIFVIGTGPGAPGMAITVLTESQYVAGMVRSVPGIATSAIRSGSAAKPIPAVAAPSHYDEVAEGQAGSHYQVIDEGEPAAVGPGGLIGEALGADGADNKPPPKFYTHKKSIGAAYLMENADGSHHLPEIIENGHKAVADGKVASMEAYMIRFFGWSAADVDKYITKGEKSTVRYIDPKDSIHFQLFDGNPMTQGMGVEDVFDTKDMFSKVSGKGFGIYVMDGSGNMFAAQHKIGLFHHSSFLSGGDVAGAGEIKVTDGRVEWVTNKTGHYKAGKDELWQVLDELKSRGVDLGSVKVSTYDEPKGQSRPGNAAQAHIDFKPA